MPDGDYTIPNMMDVNAVFERARSLQVDINTQPRTYYEDAFKTFDQLQRMVQLLNQRVTSAQYVGNISQLLPQMSAPPQTIQPPGRDVWALPAHMVTDLIAMRPIESRIGIGPQVPSMGRIAMGMGWLSQHAFDISFAAMMMRGMIGGAIGLGMRAIALPAEALFAGFERAPIIGTAFRMAVSPAFAAQAARYLPPGMAWQAPRGLGMMELMRHWAARTGAGFRYIADAPTLYEALGRLGESRVLGLGMLSRLESPIARTVGITGRGGLTALRLGLRGSELVLGAMLWDLPFMAATEIGIAGFSGVYQGAQMSRMVDTLVSAPVLTRLSLARTLTEDVYSDLRRNIRERIMYGIGRGEMFGLYRAAMPIAAALTRQDWGITDVREFRRTVQDIVQEFKTLSRTVREFNQAVIGNVAAIMAPGLRQLPVQMRGRLVGQTVADIVAAANQFGITAEEAVGMATEGARAFAAAGMPFPQALGMAWGARLQVMAPERETARMLIQTLPQLLTHPINRYFQLYWYRGQNVPMNLLQQAPAVPTTPTDVLRFLHEGPAIQAMLGPSATMTAYGGLISTMLRGMGAEVSPETVGGLMQLLFPGMPADMAQMVGSQAILAPATDAFAKFNEYMAASLEAQRATWFKRKFYKIPGMLTIATGLSQLTNSVAQVTSDLLFAASTSWRLMVDKLRLWLKLPFRPLDVQLDMGQFLDIVNSKAFKEAYQQYAEQEMVVSRVADQRAQVLSRFESAKGLLETIEKVAEAYSTTSNQRTYGERSKTWKKISAMNVLSIHLKRLELPPDEIRGLLSKFPAVFHLIEQYLERYPLGTAGRAAKIEDMISKAFGGIGFGTKAIERIIERAKAEEKAPTGYFMEIYKLFEEWPRKTPEEKSAAEQRLFQLLEDIGIEEPLMSALREHGYKAVKEALKTLPAIELAAATRKFGISPALLLQAQSISAYYAKTKKEEMGFEKAYEKAKELAQSAGVDLTSYLKTTTSRQEDITVVYEGVNRALLNVIKMPEVKKFLEGR